MSDKRNSGRLSASDWSRYWRQPALTTFSRSFAGNYDAEFREFWIQSLEPLPDGAVVVDLATGNGAVAVIVAEFGLSTDQDFRIIGVDYAAIDPHQELKSRLDLAKALDKVSFLPDTKMEETGLPDSSCDLLVSQYGFEYGDTQLASAEAVRLLKPAGRLAMILHHVDSHVLRESDEGLSQMRYMLTKERLDERVEVLIRARATGHQGKVRIAEAKLRATLGRLETRANRANDKRGFINSLMPNFLSILDSRVARSLDQELSALREVRAEILAYKQRMADLRSAAVDEDRLLEICNALRAAGLANLETGLLHYGPDRQLMGWTIVGSREASLTG